MFCCICLKGLDISVRSEEFLIGGQDSIPLRAWHGAMGEP